MRFSEYQAGTATTAIYRDQIGEILRGMISAKYRQSDPDSMDKLTRLLSVAYVGNGLGEVGEVQGKIKKIIRDSGGVITDEHRAAVAKELGDCLWYISQAATEFGLDLDEVAQGNLDKLAGRKERGTLQGSGDDR